MHQDSMSPSGAALPGPPKPAPVPSMERFARILEMPESPYMQALRHGVMLMVPLLLAAAIGILVNNVPLQIYQDFMTYTFGPDWKQPGILVETATIRIMGIAVAYTLTDTLMNLHNQRHPGEEIPVPLGVLVTLSCFFIMLNPRYEDGWLHVQWVGLSGLLGTVVLTFACCGLFLRLCRIKHLRVRFFSEGSDPLLPHIFDTLLPALCTMGVFILISRSLASSGVESVFQVFYNALTHLFQGAEDSFVLGALYAFLVQVFWFLGVHGANFLDPATHNIFVEGMAANSAAINQGLAPPHIFTKYFFDVFIYMGGSGGTLGLIIATFLRSKDTGSRRIASLSLVPGIFNINELFLFGLPVVYNITFLIPFVCVPLVLLTISYFAVGSGLVPPPVYQVDWTTPPVVNAFLSTGSWKGVCLQLINIAVSIAIYMPFVTLADRSRFSSRTSAFNSLVKIAESRTRGPSGKRCIDRYGSPGALARSLANDLFDTLERGEDISLHYQPRVSLLSKSVPAVKALLRWKHPVYGYVPPELIFAVAEDSDLISRLDKHILQIACEQQWHWRQEGIVTAVSLKLSESQLADRNLPLLLSSLLSRYYLPTDAIMFDVPEGLVLDPESRFMSCLLALRDTGVKLSIASFGRGYRSMGQIKTLSLVELQLDQSLINSVAHDKSSQEVVGIIQELCVKMGINTAAEFVETREQLEALLELNIGTFQGYYFAKPVPPDDCASFIREFNRR